MKLIFFSAAMLVSCYAVAQVSRPGTPPDEVKLSASVAGDESNYPCKINLQQKYRYGTNWGEYNYPMVQLNKSCDTMELNPLDALKIIKIGPKYYKVIKSGVEYSLELLYRKPVQY